MVPCVGIDVVENRLCPVLPIFRNQRLHQQPRGRGGLHIGHRQETGIDRIGQILQAGGHGQIIFLQNLCIDNNGALLGGNGRGIVRDLLQGIHREGQGDKHCVLLLGTLEIEGAHGDQVRLQVGPFGQELPPQFRGAKGLEDILARIAAGVQGVGHGGNRLFVGVGVNDNLLRRGTAFRGLLLAAAAQQGHSHGQGQTQRQ